MKTSNRNNRMRHDADSTMNRRQALTRVSLMLGGAICPNLAAAVMGQVLNNGKSVEVNAETTALLAELVDLIIPNTDTPGAKAAGVEQFIIRVMRDCYSLTRQERFYGGLSGLENDCRNQHDGASFTEIEVDERAALLKQFAKKDEIFFKQLRQLTITGYFTSEIGATQALEYLPVPGRFEGDVPMKPGQKAWAISR